MSMKIDDVAAIQFGFVNLINTFPNDKNLLPTAFL